MLKEIKCPACDNLVIGTEELVNDSVFNKVIRFNLNKASGDFTYIRDNVTYHNMDICNECKLKLINTGKVNGRYYL